MSFSKILMSFFMIYCHGCYGSIKPVLNGVFYELYTDVYNWNLTQWEQEFKSIKDINISYVAFRTVYDANYPNYTENNDCIFGTFTAFYPSNIVNCTIVSPYDTTNMILNAADKYGINVHLGLAFPIQSNGDQNWWIQYELLCEQVFKELYDLYMNPNSPTYHSSFIGIYTVFEIGNFVSTLSYLDIFIDNFIHPLSTYIKTLNQSIPVWGSPYYKNPTNTNIPPLLTPTEYAQLWDEVFTRSPNFDFIAPQDGVGASNNSINNYTYVKQYLSELIKISRNNNRIIWSNAESFQFNIWNEGTNCNTIQTVNPINRFISQLNIESSMDIDSLISWEYHSYMSINAGPCQWSNIAHQFYGNYSLYLNTLS